MVRCVDNPAPQMLSDLLKWGGKRSSTGDIAPPKGGDVVVSSKALGRFIAAGKLNLAQRGQTAAETSRAASLQADELVAK